MKKMIIGFLALLLVSCTVLDYTDRGVVTYLVEGDSVDTIEYVDNMGRRVYCVFPTPFIVSVGMIEDSTISVSASGRSDISISVTFEYYSGQTVYYNATESKSIEVNSLDIF